MAPIPSVLPLSDAVIWTAEALKLPWERARSVLLDGLCDGAILANAISPSKNGPPNWLTISPANWQMHKYNGAELHYDFIEIATVDLMSWLRLDERQNLALHAALESVAQLALTRDAALIRKCIRAVYAAAATQTVKPPNINELPDCVNKLLARQSCRALNEQIKKIGQEPDFAPLRPSQGRRSSASLKRLTELDLSEVAIL